MTYKEKYNALQVAIEFEIESLESRISTLKARFDSIDNDATPTIFQSCDKGMQTAYEIELDTLKRWVRK